MIIVADVGNTTADWGVIHKGEILYYKTTGFSPYFTKPSEIINLLEKELLPNIDVKLVRSLFFYGTSCSSDVNKNIIKETLSNIFGNAEIFVDSDLLAAAKALCGNNEGIACILGTGSNSCYYNGNKIQDNKLSLGYILGDQGSGAYLGKRLLYDYFHNKLPDNLKQELTKFANVSDKEIISNLYSTDKPSSYLASFAPFLHKHNNNKYVNDLLTDSFNEFIVNCVKIYPESKHLPINFVGSIAYLYKDLISTLLKNNDLQAGKFISSPIKDLSIFHKELGI
ncbi:MAG: ATPase [Lentimicrobiaceae bacterium]|nr:ATPase [Lentimicrobiaceae bacterium]